MKTPEWVRNAIFYHIYPLGLLDAPRYNDASISAAQRINQLYPWLDHIQSLGANALYLGPLMESESHGYDTRNYFLLDRRLGSNQDLQNLVREVHRRGMHIILDGVFNHSGRSFWAFEDILQNQQQSAYRDWYQGLRFGQGNPRGDSFDYQTWDGHYSLPKFNLANPQVRQHLLQAIQFWIDTFDIDGLRLDAADHVQIDFWQELRALVSTSHPDFWLMGEIVHGDYGHWANEKTLHSVTNYAAYKGLYSSFNDANFFEIAHTLKQQFGQDGLYRNLLLYNFVDNHDVNRIASQLKNPAHLYPLYALLFCMPGIPSIYYGSEWAVPGKRSPKSDSDLRPALSLSSMHAQSLKPELINTIQRFSGLRQQIPALHQGSYRQELVQAQQLAFWRETESQKVLVVINAANEAINLPSLNVPDDKKWYDPFQTQEQTEIREDGIHLAIPANWLRMIVFDGIN